MNGVTFVLVGLLVLLCVLLLVKYLVTDARRRGKEALPVVLPAIFFFPLGLLIWLVIRPRRLPMAGPFDFGRVPVLPKRL